MLTQDFVVFLSRVLILLLQGNYLQISLTCLGLCFGVAEGEWRVGSQLDIWVFYLS